MASVHPWWPPRLSHCRTISGRRQNRNRRALHAGHDRPTSIARHTPRSGRTVVVAECWGRRPL